MIGFITNIAELVGFGFCEAVYKATIAFLVFFFLFPDLYF